MHKYQFISEGLTEKQKKIKRVETIQDDFVFRKRVDFNTGIEYIDINPQYVKSMSQNRDVQPIYSNFENFHVEAVDFHVDQTTITLTLKMKVSQQKNWVEFLNQRASVTINKQNFTFLIQSINVNYLEEKQVSIDIKGISE